MAKTGRKYRQQSRQKQRANDARGVIAKDGYTNPLASIGEASPLVQGGQYVRKSLSGDVEKLTVLYRENWITQRIIDIPAEDMTSKWYTPVTQLDESRIKELQALENKHDIKGELADAIRWARLYGGSLAIIVIKGQEDMLDKPLDMDMLMPGCFRGLMVVDRWQGISPSMTLVEDLDDVDFGYPEYYDVYLDSFKSKHIRVHHSRCLVFRGRPLPHNEEVGEDYWGAPEMEHVIEELTKRDETSANIAQLMFQANVTTLRMSDFGEMMAMGTDNQRAKIYEAIQIQNRMRTSFGLQVMSANDSLEQHQYSFAGVADVYEQFMMDICGAAEMPATKLFGRSPQGMNATGDSDLQNYYDSISRKQEKVLKPALERLIPIECMSLWGKIPNDIEIIFEPIGTTTPSERATIAGQITTTVTSAYSAGLISQKTALMELRENGKDIGVWTKITDEDIDKADEEADSGEGGGMLPPGVPGAEQGALPPGGEGQGQAPEGGFPGQQHAPDEDTVQKEGPALSRALRHFAE